MQIGCRVVVPFGRKKYYTAIVRNVHYCAPTEYEVKEHIDTIMVGFRGFSKEVSIVKWNDKNPVFDIRAWRVSDRDGLQYPLRGITFSKEEFIKLREILNSIDVNCIDEYM